MQIEIEGEMVEYTPYKDDMYLIDLQEMLSMNRTMVRVFKRNLTEQFMSRLKGVTSLSTTGFNLNTIISVHAETGKGKSATVFSLGLKYFPNFSNENLFFYDQDILNNAHKFKEHDLVVRDENPAKAVFGQGSVRTQEQFGLLAETCRKSSLNLAMIEPSFQKNNITKIYLHVIDQDLKHRVNRCGLIHPDTLRYVGAVLIPIMPENHPEWVKYQQKKDDFIEAMKRGDLTGSKLNYKSIAQDAIDDPEFEKYRNKTEKKAYLLTKFPNYTTGEIETILAMVNVIEREYDGGS